MSFQLRCFSVAAVVFILAGCHGGGSSPALPAVGNNSLQSIATAGTASFTVSVPAPGNGAIPHSVVIALTNGNRNTTLTTMNLSMSTPGCKAMLGGGLACFAIVSAPVGTNTFSITTYSGRNGGGSVISTAPVKASVIASKNAACPPTNHDRAMMRGAQ